MLNYLALACLSLEHKKAFWGEGLSLRVCLALLKKGTSHLILDPNQFNDATLRTRNTNCPNIRTTSYLQYLKHILYYKSTPRLNHDRKPQNLITLIPQYKYTQRNRDM